MAPILTATWAPIQPFAVTLARFSMFAHGQRGATLYLAPKPAEPVIELQTRLWEALPRYDDTRRHSRGFTPHLSVGQARGEAEARVLLDTLFASWQPLVVNATAAQLSWRGEPPDDIFRVAHTFQFGSR